MSTQSPAYPFSLAIDALEVPVRLGVGEEERASEQKITVWLKLFYAAPPEGARADGGDYLCYDTLCRAMLDAANERPFQLLENLCAHLFSTARAQVPASVPLWIEVRKNLPPSLVPYAVYGASVTYTDLPCGIVP